MFSNYAISAGHELTLAIAKTILKEGGNAFDAAISAYLAMFITEPCMASAGGNGFALLKPKAGKVQFLDFFCQTPKTKNLEKVEFYPILVNFGTETETFHIGLGSAAVPGAIAAIFKIHELFGSIPFKYLIQPVQELAKEGVILNEFQAYDLELLAPIFKEDQSVRDIFFHEDKIKKEGMKIKMANYADFLDFLNDEGSRGFYHGEIAERIEKDSRERGGMLRREDFENYKVGISDPFNIPWKNKTIHLPNGPSKGGIAAALFFSEVENHPLGIANAIKSAQLSLNDEENLISLINQKFSNNNLNYTSGSDALNGTSHFNILDKAGNAVSLTSSIGEGCGYFIPGTDMHLNNMLGEVFLLPNGAHSWKENTRMNSMMTPNMITDQQGNLEFLSGSGGASRIPYAISQVIYQIYENQLSLQDATDLSRYHYQKELIQIEGGAAWDTQGEDQLVWDKKSLYFGGVHSISALNGKLDAYGDPRRFGVAEVF